MGILGIFADNIVAGGVDVFVRVIIPEKWGPLQTRNDTKYRDLIYEVTTDTRENHESHKACMGSRPELEDAWSQKS